MKGFKLERGDDNGRRFVTERQTKGDGRKVNFNFFAH